MILGKIKNKLFRAKVSVLRFFHRLGGHFGLWYHYQIRGANAGEGFTVHALGYVLMRITVDGYQHLDFQPEWIKEPFTTVKLHSTYDWPIAILGEYKPWKVTFIKD